MLAEADVLGEAEEVAGAEDREPADVAAVPEGVTVTAVPDGVAMGVGVA
jgi:hypothetical protein